MRIPPVVRIALPFIIGIAIVGQGDGALCGKTGMTILLATSGLSTLLLFIFHGRKSTRGYPFGIAVVVLSMACGMLRMAISHYQLRSATASGGRVKAVVESIPEEKEKVWSMKIREEAEDDGYQLLYIRKDSLHDPSILLPGDTLIFKSMPPTYTYAALTQEEDSFSYYRRYLYNQHIYCTRFVFPAQWHVGGRSPGLSYRLKRLQRLITSDYDSLGIPRAERAVLQAMTVGAKALLRQTATSSRSSLQELYSSAGVSHVLALSGFHVGMIYAILHFLFMSRIISRRWRWVTGSAVVVVLWLFALVAGLPPSLTRAVVMCTIMSIATMLHRQAFGFSTITTAALIMLAYNPFCLMDVGFQLSFASVTAISACSPWLTNLNIRIQKTGWHGLIRYPLNYIASAFLITIVCTIATAGLVAHYFGAISLVGIFSNLIVSTLAILLMGCSILWWLTKWFGLGGLFGSLLGTLALWMNNSVEYLGSLSFSHLSWQPGTTGLIVYYLIFLSLFAWVRKSQK